jgi:hypothetical protein
MNNGFKSIELRIAIRNNTENLFILMRKYKVDEFFKLFEFPLYFVY